jgi:hypothetical protein
MVARQAHARVRLVVAAAGLATALALAPTILARGATVTRGELRAFATGVGMDISGHAQMVRTPDGKTIVSIHVAGLAPNTSYPAHVHQLPCGTSDADGHYKNDLAGPAAPPNEIWPLFTPRPWSSTHRMA